MFFMEHVRGIKIQEAVSLWREIDQNVKNESYSSLRGKIRRAAEKGIIDTAWFSGDGYKLYKNTDVIKFAKSQMKSEPVTNCNQTEQPTSDCSQLPKLTAEVFDHPDCPEWAKWAAVNADGNLFFFEEKPVNNIVCGGWHVEGCKVISFFNKKKFAPSDWQNSLIERPAKLPEWCKQGEWIYTSSEQYLKIEGISIDLQKIELSNGAIWSKQDIIDEAVPARLRLYNAEEMQGLIGKVVGNEHGNMFLITAFVAYDGGEVCADGVVYNADDLLETYTINGSPCGVLEHLENGEWVK
jgi:hypothetical protein